MRPSLKHLSVACAGTLLMACVQVGQVAPPPLLAAFGQADQAYLAGRSAHLALRLDEASAAYHRALRADPAHVNAQNGLATLYAEQGEYAKAISVWRKLTAAAPPTAASAYLFSNLGYAQLLEGDHAAAVVALEKACLLDPLSHRAWRHLGSALEKLGQQERAQQMLQQAAALETHDFKADYGLARRSGVAPIDSAVAVAVAADSDADAGGYPVSELHESASGIFELRRTGVAAIGAPAAAVANPAAGPAAAAAAAAAAAPAPAAAAAAAPASDPAAPAAAQGAALAAGREPVAPAAAAPERTSLEIRNGNGVTGMARRLARRLGEAGVRVTRLSNQKGFNVEHTRIEYQPGFREAALRLAERFDDAALVEVGHGDAADVRLVLGRDLMRSKLEARRLIRAALARAAARNPL